MTEFLAYLTHKAPREHADIQELIAYKPELPQTMPHSHNKIKQTQDIIQHFKKTQDSVTCQADKLVASYASNLSKDKVTLNTDDNIGQGEQDSRVIQLCQVVNSMSLIQDQVNNESKDNANDFTINNILKEDVFNFHQSEIEIVQDTSNNLSQDVQNFCQLSFRDEAALNQIKNNSNLNIMMNISNLQQQIEPDQQLNESKNEKSGRIEQRQDECVMNDENLKKIQCIQKQYCTVLPTSRNEDKVILQNSLGKDYNTSTFQTARKSFTNNSQSSKNTTQIANNSSFNFTLLVDQIERAQVFRELCEIDDPSKIILMITKGLLNLMSLISTGRYSELISWPEIKIEFSVNKANLYKQMRLFERVARFKRFNHSHVQVLNDQYLNSTEIGLALRSTKRHFAFDLIVFLQQGVNFMQLIIDKKIKKLTQPIEYQTNSTKRQPKGLMKDDIRPINENEEYKGCRVVQMQAFIHQYPFRMRRKLEGSIERQDPVPFENINNRINQKIIVPLNGYNTEQFQKIPSNKAPSTIQDKGQQSFINNNSFCTFLNNSNAQKENSRYAIFNDQVKKRNKSGSSHSRTLTPQFKIYDNNLSVCTSSSVSANRKKKRRQSMHLLMPHSKLNENSSDKIKENLIDIKPIKEIEVRKSLGVTSKKPVQCFRQTMRDKSRSQTRDISQPRTIKSGTRNTHFNPTKTLGQINDSELKKMIKEPLIQNTQLLQPILSIGKSRTRVGPSNAYDQMYRTLGNSKTSNALECNKTKESLKQKQTKKDSTWLQKEVLKDKQRLEQTIKNISKVQQQSQVKTYESVKASKQFATTMTLNNKNKWI